MKDAAVPQHVAMIMDGNRRWAKSHSLPILEGHRRGEQRIEPIIDAAVELGIQYLTFWAFSTENWNRTAEEVSLLLRLYRQALEKRVDSFHRKNVRVHVIGNLSQFPKDIQEKTAAWMEKTKNNTTLTVNVALSYGGKDEIVRAVNKCISQERRTQNESPITKNDISLSLDTAGQPDPDLLIRTGGEQRLSGFMLWQLEYAELYFPDIFWPDFTPEKFKEAVEEYGKRQRRFGK